MNKISSSFVLLLCGCYTMIALPKTGTTFNRPIVIMGNWDMPPYNFINDEGKPDGYNLELMTTILKRRGLSYTVRITDWKTALDHIHNGKADLTTMIFSNERTKLFKFGPVIKYVTKYIICRNNDMSFSRDSDIIGKTIMVKSASSSLDILRQTKMNCNIIEGNSIAKGLEELSAGKYDAVFCTYESALYYIRKYHLNNLKLVDIGFTPQEYRIAGNNEELMALMSIELNKMKKDGTFEKITNKWLNKYQQFKIPILIYIILCFLVALAISLYLINIFLYKKIRKSKKTISRKSSQMTLALQAGNIHIWAFNLAKKRFFNVEGDTFPENGIPYNEEMKLIHPDDKRTFDIIMNNASNGILSNKPLHIRVDKENKRIWRYIELNINIEYSSKGEIERIIGTQKDITADIILKKRLKEEKEKAQEADKLKSVFVANMSHEIRTPLNAIVGFSNILSEITDKNEREQCITMINNNSDLLLRLVNDILDLSRLDSGAIDLQCTNFDLSQLIANLYSSLNKTYSKPHIHFLYEIPYKKCLIYADPNRISQLVTNFVTNAFKYTEKGHIKISYVYVDKGIKLMVEDTGVGIPKNKQAIVFKRFEKLGSVKQGAGLGMSICKAIIDKCGGKIDVDSEEGKGSTFWAWFPCKVEYE